MYGMVLPTISSSSHPFIASSDGFVPTIAIDPVVYGLSSGTQSLPSIAFTMGAARRSANCSSSLRHPRAPAPARIQIFFLPSKSFAAASTSLRCGARSC